MKFNFKKISAVLGSALLTLGLTTVPVTADAAPFAVGGHGDVAIVYGTGHDDAQALNTIGNWLGEYIDEATVAPGVGEESVNLNDVGHNLLLGNHTKAIVDDYELPSLFADRTIRAGGETVEYSTFMNIGHESQMIKFESLGGEDEYVVNTDLASDLRPVLHIDQSDNPVWSLTLEFDDDFDATDVRSGQSLIIGGKEYSVAPGLSKTDDLLLYAASQSEVLGFQETTTFSVNGKTYDVTITGGKEDTPSDLVHLRIEGETFRNLAAGDDVVLADGQKFIVNEVAVTSVGVEVDTIEAEIFAGAEELEILRGTTPRRVNLDGESVRSVEGWVETGLEGLEEVQSLTIRFTPSDLRDSHFESLELGETLTDSVLGTIAMTFESASQDFKEGKEYFGLEVRGNDELRLTVTNDRGNEFVFYPYELNDEATEIELRVLEGDLTGLTPEGHEDMYFIVEGTQGESVVFEIEDIYLSEVLDESEIVITHMSTGNQEVVEVGKHFLSRNYYVCLDDDTPSSLSITTDACDADLTWGDPEKTAKIGTGEATLAASSLTFEANNEVMVELGEPTEMATITITEHDDGDHDPEVLPFELSISEDGDFDMLVKFNKGEDVQGGSDDDGDYGYYLTQLGTYIETEEDDWSWARLWVPEDTVEYNVYIGSVAVDEDVEVVTGVPRVADTEAATMADKNLIVVGGSAINRVAADLLGLSFPAYGEEWQTETGVGAGHYLIETFRSPYSDDKVATLVAGYNAADTRAAANKLAADYDVMDFEEGKKYATVGVAGDFLMEQ